jgi:hypothetical protein
MHPVAFMVGGFIGAFIPTFLLSRLLLWLLKKWDGGTRKIILVHAVSLTACILFAIWDTFYIGGLRWSRWSEQIFRLDKWSLCRV